MIAWHEFSWEAFATLAAVFGAVFVGWRQAGILANQTKLKEQEIRIALFDRRFATFKTVQKFLDAILRNTDRLTPSEEQEFLVAKADARFLFSDSANTNIQQLWRKYCEFSALKAEMESLYRREGHYGVGNPARQQEFIHWFSDTFRMLDETFAAMKLAEVR